MEKYKIKEIGTVVTGNNRAMKRLEDEDIAREQDARLA